MEHIVQFGINIDDTAIRKAIENNVERQVVGELKKDVMRQLTGKKDFTNHEYTTKLKFMIEDSIDQFLEVYKDDIIKTAADKLAERLSRTKAVKEMVSKQIEDIMNK